MKGLLISAYDAASHQSWHRSLRHELNHIEWTLVTLPPRHFSWRVRGNSLSLAFRQRNVLEQPFDVLIATSMTDLVSLRGLVPSLTQIPNILYFHENQFTYPDGHDERNRLHIQLSSILTALAADVRVFNSDWNRRSFISGAKTLLASMPDEVPNDLPERLESTSRVIPVGLTPALFERDWNPPSDKTLTLLWNHRWEFDKGPDRLLLALQQLRDRGVAFRLNLLGQQFRQHPPVFEAIKSTFSESIDHCGYIENQDDYQSVVSASDLVLSTSLHDFQGLSMLESAAAGVRPVLPDRLAYPEWFGEAYRYPASDDPEEESRHLADHVEQWIVSGRPEFDRQTLSSLSWPCIADQWRTLLSEL